MEKARFILKMETFMMGIGLKTTKVEEERFILLLMINFRNFIMGNLAIRYIMDLDVIIIRIIAFKSDIGRMIILQGIRRKFRMGKWLKVGFMKMISWLGKLVRMRLCFRGIGRNI